MIFTIFFTIIKTPYISDPCEIFFFVGPNVLIGIEKFETISFATLMSPSHVGSIFCLISVIISQKTFLGRVVPNPKITIILLLAEFLTFFLGLKFFGKSIPTKISFVKKFYEFFIDCISKLHWPLNPLCPCLIAMVRFPGFPGNQFFLFMDTLILIFIVFCIQIWG